MDAHLVKPVNMEPLEKTVRKFRMGKNDTEYYRHAPLSTALDFNLIATKRPLPAVDKGLFVLVSVYRKEMKNVESASRAQRS